MSEFEEAENWTTSNVHYKATRSQANAIAIAMSALPELRRRRILAWVIDSVSVEHPGGDGLAKLEALCTELVDLDVKIEKLALQVIRKNGGEA